MSGRLRRSLRAQVIHSGIRFSSSMPYASAHNEGYDGTVRVQTHFRRAHSARRVQGKAHAVRAHAKHIKLPERRFVGDAPEVKQAIEQCVQKEMSAFADQLTQLLKQSEQ